MKGLFALVAIVLSFATAPQARAAVVWDYSPDTTGSGITDDYIGPFFNRADLQYFADTVRFRHAVRLTGMDIYDPVHTEGPMPEQVIVRVWPDENGSPGAELIEFEASITSVDAEGTMTLAGYQRVNATFAAPVDLAANTDYWIGMSGFDKALGQLTLNANPPGDSRVFVFDTRNRLALLTGPHVGDMAFRLHGTALVPLPGAAVLLASALLTLTTARRRARMSATGGGGPMRARLPGPHRGAPGESWKA